MDAVDLSDLPDVARAAYPSSSMSHSAPATSRPRTVRSRVRSPRSSRGDAISLGVLSARVAAACRRVIAGQVLSALDKEVVRETANRMREEAGAILFVSTGGSQGTLPRRGAAAGMGVTALSEDAPDDPTAFADFLYQVSDGLDEFAQTGKRQLAKQLTGLFDELATLARSEAGSAGERIIRSS